MAETNVGVAIITYRARDLLQTCVEPLRQSPLKARILVVNSSSDDGTVDEAKRLGLETLIVPRDEFNHGRTRELARKQLNTRYVVMLTPDAVAADSAFLEKLTAPLAQGIAQVAYARQLPRDEADLIERFNRQFNYSDKSHIRSASDWPVYKSYTRFCSNAACAWDNEFLDRIGGFRSTLVSEETVAACEILNAGGQIAYVAEAQVKHSHGSSLLGDFRRQFDVGYTRHIHSDILLERGRDEERGLVYIRNLLSYLYNHQKRLIPYAILNTAMRYAGYRFGMLGQKLPLFINAQLSSQDFYWLKKRGSHSAKTAKASLH